VKPNNKNLPSSYELYFSNNLTPKYLGKDYPENNLTRIKVVPTGEEQNLIFPVRGNAYWALGGICDSLKLSVPAKTDIELLAISLPDASSVIPLTKAHSFIKLNRINSKEQIVYYDAVHVKNCKQVAMEIVGPYDYDRLATGFETLYADKSDKNAIFSMSGNTTSGALKIQHVIFPKKGFYQARFRALDANGQQVGLAGDHFLIHVE
jgi:hypothetical protein